MGIESDQLVYDYLSRVGDLAQQRQLPSGDRMRLVSSLRNEIDRQRGKFESESPATVRRILGRLGSPDELVTAATDGSLPAPSVREEPRARRIPRPRRTEKTAPPGEAPQAPAASPPHLAGTDELGPSGSEPDWWRIETAPFGAAGDEVPGFVGGVEIPEILRPPRKAEPEREPEDDEESEEEEFEEAEEDEEETPRRRVLRRRSRAPRVQAPLANPLLLLAAALLVTGAVTGWLLALGAGWLLAYTSRRLSRAEAKWAALGLPGLVAAGGLTWLWGRTDGRWGTPIPEHGMGTAITELWPVLVKVAAVLSALYLVWRARRDLR
ncbi:hypothetical protein [Streptomyces beijiangensis]|uniref:Uncharacterized protein n=1 Tax=Streptomyces beijiangensis TaxID=163361 RepID=A0A939JGL9_9ACTN|nr:hypothetical protein [Streptomyces beijiangensis]MBO0515326.1 hypothetical protein [Streptomyces beijiangensis]